MNPVRNRGRSKNQNTMQKNNLNTTHINDNKRVNSPRPISNGVNLKSTIKFSPVDADGRKNLGLKPGNKIKVWQKIKEKDKTRLQAFEGIILARKHGNEPGATITVRAIFDGIGVERIFPLYSPIIEKIEIISRSKTKRAKLYYLRKKAAKEIRKKIHPVKSLAMSDVIAGTET